MHGKLVLASVAFALAVTIAGSARAEEEFDISVSHREVKVSSHAPWHINQEFHWKLKEPDGTKVDGFALEEKTATLSNPPAGKHVLKGAVCFQEGDKKACKVIELEITVP